MAAHEELWKATEEANPVQRWVHDVNALFGDIWNNAAVPFPRLQGDMQGREDAPWGGPDPSVPHNANSDLPGAGPLTGPARPLAPVHVPSVDVSSEDASTTKLWSGQTYNASRVLSEHRRGQSEEGDAWDGMPASPPTPGGHDAPQVRTQVSRAHVCLAPAWASGQLCFLCDTLAELRLQSDDHTRSNANAGSCVCRLANRTAAHRATPF